MGQISFNSQFASEVHDVIGFDRGKGKAIHAKEVPILPSGTRDHV